MPSKPAPRKPANRPPRNPGRLRKPPTVDDTGGRCASVLPGWPGCVMLRSMGRALGDVAVDGGAEKVCEPRLPKLPPRPARASASVIAKANTAATAQSASSGRTPKESIESSQKTVWSHPNIGIAWRHCKRCRMVSQIPCRRHIWQPRILIGSFYSARPRESGDPDRDSGLDSQHKRVHARLDALCAGMSGGPG